MTAQQQALADLAELTLGVGQRFHACSDAYQNGYHETINDITEQAHDSLDTADRIVNETIDDLTLDDYDHGRHDALRDARRILDAALGRADNTTHDAV